MSDLSRFIKAQETDYERALSDQEMIDLLATDGMMVKRPLLITDSDVLVGFKESEWEEKVL